MRGLDVLAAVNPDGAASWSGRPLLMDVPTCCVCLSLLLQRSVLCSEGPHCAPRVSSAFATFGCGPRCVSRYHLRQLLRDQESHDCLLCSGVDKPARAPHWICCGCSLQKPVHICIQLKMTETRTYPRVPNPTVSTHVRRVQAAAAAARRGAAAESHPGHGGLRAAHQPRQRGGRRAGRLH